MAIFQKYIMIGLFPVLLFYPHTVAADGGSSVWSFSGSRSSSAAYWSNATTLQQIRAATETEEPDDGTADQAKTASPIEVGLEDKSTSWHAETPVEKSGETRLRTH